MYFGVYRGFGHAKFFRSLAHSCAVFDHVDRKLTGALLDITFQDPTRSLSRYALIVCTWEWEHAVDMV